MDQTNEVSQTQASTFAQLRIMATTDLHMNLTGFDYYADRPDPTVGLTRVATLIQEARGQAAKDGITTLLFDNGDALQGTPMGEVLAPQLNQRHPLMQAFCHLRYDAIGLGNHDFNFGLPALDAALGQAPCPVVCSNMRRLDGINLAESFAILDRHVQVATGSVPIRIGVVSFLPPQTLKWDAHFLDGRVEIDGILESAATFIDRLRQAGCDLIIALAHSGLAEANAYATQENAVIPLAGLNGIDIVIAGHTHLQLPGSEPAGRDDVDCVTGTIHGKPVVMAGSAGSHLGIIDLDLKITTDGSWSVANHRCMLRPIAEHTRNCGTKSLVPEDDRLSAILAPHHQATRCHMRRPVGHIDQALHSYFALFGSDASLALVATAQATALRPLLAGTDVENLPLLSAVAPGKFGGRSGPLWYTDVPAGPLSLRHLADLHIYPNTLQAVVLTGAQVLDWLEMSASQFYQIEPGSEGRMLIDCTMAGFHFDVVFGLDYHIELSIPQRFWPDGRLRNSDARRIVSATYQGVAVQKSQKFIVALNNYRASGGGNVAALNEASPIVLPRIHIRDTLRSFIGNATRDDPLSIAPDPWRFSPMPGTYVTALTGPGAMPYLSELTDQGVVATGVDTKGFLTLRIPL